MSNKNRKSNIPKYDPRDLAHVECAGEIDGLPCKGIVFIPAKEIRRVPTLVEVPGSPIGHEGYVPFDVAVCPKCWTPLPPKP